jgi:hypothetical protein
MTSYTITQIPAPRTPLIDETTGLLSREWFRWFNNLNNIVGGGLGVIAVINGGTGQSTYTNGQLLIGNSTGNTLSKNTLTPGAGIGVTNGPGSIDIANTGVLSNLAGAGIAVDQATGDVTIDNTGVLSAIAGAGIAVNQATGDVTIDNTGVLSVIAGTGISVSSATGNVTIANTAVGVTSFSAGTTGLTPNSPTTGAVVLAGTLALTNGGTGATTDSGARTNLGLGSGLSVTITTAQLTPVGTQGSMTFVNGILTAQTQAT